ERWGGGYCSRPGPPRRPLGGDPAVLGVHPVRWANAARSLPRRADRTPEACARGPWDLSVTPCPTALLRLQATSILVLGNPHGGALIAPGRSSARWAPRLPCVCRSDRRMPRLGPASLRPGLPDEGAGRLDH